MSLFSRFLARRRVWLFFAVVCLVVGGALLVPHITVNTDMTKYLPDDYPMKQGLDLIRQQLPDMEEQIQNLGSSFGDGADMMPTNLPRTLAIGVSLLFVVLLIMCSSLMEVLLFLITAICAVILNMGTNALLSDVSMVTNTLTPVLQMVLSMDYSIILMNRYRQERLQGRIPSDAIAGALSGATPSILSSAFTTIVSLLMLTFIKLKIGADLGYVLAKGVTFSLLCNFTVLPALIVWADKSVIFKTKKTPRFPSAAVSRFQTRFRVPLAILFIVLVTSVAVLQRRTPINFAPHWISKATETERSDNPLLLLYATSEEAALPELMQHLEADPNVMLAVSYPTTLGKPCTAEEMYGMMADFGASDFPEEFLQMVFYAMAHPAGGGRLSFAEIEASAKRLSEEGMMPEGMGYDYMVAQIMQQAESLTPPEPEMLQVTQVPVPDAEPLTASATDTIDTTEILLAEAVADTVALSLVHAPDSAAVAVEVITPPEGIPALTYQDMTTPRTATQMAALLGVNASQMSMAYRMAGHARGTMSLQELYTYAKDNILNDRRYEAFIPKDMKQQLVAAGEYAEAVIAAGERAEKVALADTLAVAEALPLQEPVEASAEPETEIAWTQDPTLVLAPEPVQEPEPEPEPEPTPLECLIDMMLSGRRYTANQLYSALSAAGVAVSRDDIDLLYLYTLANRDFDAEQRVTPEQLIHYVSDTLLQKPSVRRLVPEETSRTLDSVQTLIAENAGMMRGENYSFAVISTSYSQESDSTFAFIDNIRASADSLLHEPHYWIGESEMYKELKDAFPSELLLLTILTVLAIYIIVAITFRSLLIPIPLVLSVLAGVYVNVIVSGFGGGTMYYLAYLIIQGILMGAAIDYSILFTSYFRDARKAQDIGQAIQTAFEGSSHSVLTSGLILTLVPIVMSFVMDDPMISSILKSLSVGALAAVIIILLLLPAVLAVLDPITTGRKSRNKQSTK